jgi:hypothetical protein
MIMRELLQILPAEKYFPLKKNRGFNEDFYTEIEPLKDFTETYYKWYNELATNKRAFAPLKCDAISNEWIIGQPLDAKDDSYYLLQMIKASNSQKNKYDQSNRLRYFLQFAYEAINYYTKEILKK